LAYNDGKKEKLQLHDPAGKEKSGGNTVRFRVAGGNGTKGVSNFSRARQGTGEAGHGTDKEPHLGRVGPPGRRQEVKYNKEGDLGPRACGLDYQQKYPGGDGGGSKGTINSENLGRLLPNAP